jgi:glycerophosphoryl diester phosphodiesterase
MPELIAHRGYPLHYPENTLPGIAVALESGARFVEVDVQMTADRVPVLFHDPDLRRLCGVPGAVADHRLAALRALSPRDPSRFGERFAGVAIPTLGEIAAFLRHWPLATLFVEVKSEALGRFGVAAVHDSVAEALAPIRQQSVPISFDLDFLLAAGSAGWTALGAVVERWEALDDPRLAPIAPAYLFTDLAHLPPTGDLAGPARRLGARLAVYEVADPEVTLALAARGVDLIETFAIAELRAALGPPTHG